MDPLREFTETQLREWVERDAKRKDLQRQADQLDAENKIVAGQITAALVAAEKTEFRRGSFRASVADGPKYPSWKDEFIKATSGEAAAAIIAKTPPSRRFTIAQV